MPWTFPLLRALLGPRPVAESNLPPVFTDFKIERGPKLDLGGLYNQSTGEGVVCFAQDMTTREMYWSLNHENMHGILHRLEGEETCNALDNLFGGFREVSAKVTEFDKALFIGDSELWLPALLRPFQSPEEIEKAKQRLKYFSGSIDVSRPGKSEVQS